MVGAAPATRFNLPTVTAWLVAAVSAAAQPAEFEVQLLETKTIAPASAAASAARCASLLPRYIETKSIAIPINPMNAISATVTIKRADPRCRSRRPKMTLGFKVFTLVDVLHDGVRGKRCGQRQR